MPSHGYKKYMKKDVKGGSPLIKIFIISFFGMLLFFTFVINYLSKVVTVDTSIGDYKEQTIDEMENKKIVDMNSLEMIQNEDQGRNFTDLIKKAEDVHTQESNETNSVQLQSPEQPQEQNKSETVAKDIVYKVFIGSYTSAEQAKVVKEIIQESGIGLNPIVKCIGTNDYTLQVGIFKNKQSAETMLMTVQKNNLPGRIVQDY